MQAGYEAIIINNNPETVSTDYTTSDKLYFEPLTVEDVMNVIDLEKPEGVIASLGGQTAINLAEPLAELGVPHHRHRTAQAIEKAENRDCFEKVMEELGIPQPEGEAVTNIEDGVRAAASIGYPVLVRPSYVLGGRAMQIVSNEERAAPLPANRRGDRRGPAGAGRPATSWARSWRWTPSATARTCSSPASWSLSSARASTRATPSASIRPSA